MIEAGIMMELHEGPSLIEMGFNFGTLHILFDISGYQIVADHSHLTHRVSLHLLVEEEMNLDMPSCNQSRYNCGYHTMDLLTIR